MKYSPLLLILLVGCAGAPLTEEQIEEREYWEQERVLAYLQWEAQCKANRNVILIYKASRTCRNHKGCIPTKWDWRYDFDKERPRHGNAYKCISRAQLRDILRGL